MADAVVGGAINIARSSFLESSWAGEPLVYTDRVTDAGLKHESISGIDSLRIHHATIGEMAGFVDGRFERD